MNRQQNGLFSRELKQFHCSILLEDVKEKVRKLKAYGVNDAEILATMNEEEMFPQVIVTEDFRILLSGEEKREVRMEPIVKAVYLLFLKHPEGIIFKHLPDYREELMQIYVKMKPYGMSERVMQSIEDVTNPCLNSIHEKCARIRAAFMNKFDEHLAKNYFITGERGEAKKITLPRDLVIWE